MRNRGLNVVLGIILILYLLELLVVLDLNRFDLVLVIFPKLLYIFIDFQKLLFNQRIG